MKVRYLCDYCGHVFSVYVYSVDNIDESCTSCKHKMTLKNIISDVDRDIFGYNKKSKDEVIRKGDAFGYNQKKKT